ncbi:hypothetical protein [uncultured Desulfobacter sp.]|uniref:hypothetical protein n=1 Tax=uncultured Desulfobacter sp. TaxID=240139 RepID=UPI002AAAD2BA|nr:hypothetical protein [uncultured Desulfobacter sp.]
MQLRFATNISVEQYIQQEAWRDAKLDQCPLHPEGGCKIARHGTYRRKSPDGAKIARWYCPEGRTTFGMLPDCLCSRLPGTLIEVETVINQIEAASSQEAAANSMRLDISLPGVLRWMRRRLFLIRLSLILLIELLPLLSNNGQETLSSFRSALGVEFVLPHLRELAGPYLDILPPPLGFGPWSQKKYRRKNRFQQQTGPDPP